METSGMKLYQSAEMLSWVGNFAERMNVSPEKIKMLNICGKKKNVLPTIETHKRVMIFADESQPDLFYELWEGGYGDYDMWLGVGTSKEDEVKTRKVKDYMDRKITEPTVIFIINENTREASRYGIRNEFFSKGSVNYVGHEIRAIIMNLISCDVGDTVCIVSGESIAIEAAIEANEGTVIAVEPDKRDMQSLQDNVSKFGVHNIEIIPTINEETMANLPAPRLAFIVASKRIEEEIAALLQKNPKMHFVVYTLELDMVVRVKNIFEKYNIEDTGVLQVAISKSDKHSVMVAQPSPWMISGEAR
ncbi:MAG: Precorrin-6B methylase 2 [Eubacteriales bacterium]|nr:Precorrin-6B methylase 2 [Eubacteriales bacterium]